MFAKSALILVSFFISTYAYSTVSTDGHYENDRTGVTLLVRGWYEKPKVTLIKNFFKWIS